ncbi:MAG: type II toxin-antitoxin system MqsA family antitoxin [Actinobacteria bacterium]|nr:type II toxin-antitoxin system MqsA family antitoxin [Actinomycetota bacterium]MCG2819421.1 type II toxin-antitoxin system MqsA family antitoxin [Actinomycetes bacterium]MBU4217898.1 type II toxin-antitoxin system MqsA family antitoxin [Actinomycetota bacterium]MBU4359756.1 type II toxin-antitoxin system MqsA family antitoxin [Actinomycetota bacterium]MBU4391292.1 type II toxin-antitoxin system MqsA family antitoxin [Actinomycetota bacterium]
MNRCTFCGGKTEEKKVTHPQEYKGKIILLENVPVIVCLQCGEVLLKPGVLEKIQEVVWTETPPKRTTPVPVFDLAEVN